MDEIFDIIPLKANGPDGRFQLNVAGLPDEITPQIVHSLWLDAKDKHPQHFKHRGYLVKIRDIVYAVQPGKNRTSVVTKI